MQHRMQVYRTLERRRSSRRILLLEMLKSSHTKQGPPKNHQAVRQTRNRDSEVDRVLIKQNGTVVVAY